MGSGINQEKYQIHINVLFADLYVIRDFHGFSIHRLDLEKQGKMNSIKCIQ